MPSIRVSKTINEDIDVDVDIEDFDDDDLLEEMIKRVKEGCYTSQELHPIFSSWHSFDFESKQRTSLEDQLKMEHFDKVMDKYSSFQIEELLPNK